MSKKVNVITLQNVRNYGSVLQALATQEVLERHGCQVRFYDFYKTSEAEARKSRLRNYCEGAGLIGRMVRTMVLLPTFARQDKLFKKFLRKYLNTIPGRVSDEKDFAALDDEADIYVTGSDQTWNSGWNNGILPPLFLSFAPDGKKRISYAASFGKEALDKDEIAETRERLSTYSAISVRERSGVDIIDDLDLGIKATHVLDPTLQVDGDFWRSKLSRPVKSQRYCFLYQLNHNADFDRFAVEFAKQRDLKLVRWCNRYDQMRLPADKKLAVPEVEDFVSYIDNADFVLTDSFHCTAFSINLNKQFLSVYPDEYGGRIASILALTGLENRRVADYSRTRYYARLKDIDYSPVNRILDENRRIADKYLEKALL